MIRLVFINYNILLITISLLVSFESIGNFLTEIVQIIYNFLIKSNHQTLFHEIFYENMEKASVLYFIEKQNYEQPFLRICILPNVRFVEFLLDWKFEFHKTVDFYSTLNNKFYHFINTNTNICCISWLSYGLRPFLWIN